MKLAAKKSKSSLLVDAGNSRLKWAYLDGDGLGPQKGILYANKSPLERFSDLIQAQRSAHIRLVLVSVLDDRFVSQARSITEQAGFAFMPIASVRKFGGVTCVYDTPEQLGADRFVAMVAAFELGNYQPCIVVDCGTAVTIDAIGVNGQHLGGLILPGLHACIDSLSKKTQQLELFDLRVQLNNFKKNGSSIFARNTRQAILNGSYLGLCGAIMQICAQIENQIIVPDKRLPLNRFITGGDAELLLDELPVGFQYEKDLIMQGLRIMSQAGP